MINLPHHIRYFFIFGLFLSCQVEEFGVAIQGVGVSFIFSVRWRNRSWRILLLSLLYISQ